MYIGFKKLNHAAVMPKRAHALDAGFDVYAPTSGVVPAGKTLLLPLGFAVSVPPCYELQIRPRSSLALKGLLVANSPGTVDSGYHGEVAVLLLNTTDSDYKIEQGDRIAQVVPVSVPFAEFVDDPRHWESDRGDGGFGSSGV